MTARPTVTGQLTFTVIGEPVPEGSKRWLGARGMIDANKARLEPWRESIRTAAHAAQLASLGDYPAPGWRPLEGPIAISLAFTMRSPKTRPRWRHHPDGRPDLDKLVRAVLDALTSIGTWLDDAQVVRLLAIKRYSADSESPRVTVELHSIGQDESITAASPGMRPTSDSDVAPGAHSAT